MAVKIQGEGESEQLGGGESESGGDREDATLLFLFHDSPRHVCSNHQSMKHALTAIRAPDGKPFAPGTPRGVENNL